MQTLVICCFDPRAVEIPQAVAEYFGDKVYPGENIIDDSGNRIGHTLTSSPRPMPVDVPFSRGTPWQPWTRSSTSKTSSWVVTRSPARRP
jgi:hypothetical protein